jgi:hypothetical protein
MLSRLGVFVVVLAAVLAAGCQRGVEGGCPAGATIVSLDGGFTCSEVTCAAGQLCIPWPASRDGSVFRHECVDVPGDCPVCECSGRTDCTAACVVALCGGAQEAAVRGRILDCPYLQ